MTNFARWPRWAAGLLLAALALLVVAAALAGGAGPQTAARAAAAKVAARHFSDIKLYRAIVDRVARGENYYAVAAEEQRAYGYPTAPAPVIREPTETLLLAGLHNDVLRHLALLSLAGASLAALWSALGELGLSPRARRWSALATLTGMAVCVAPNAAYMHEVWAGLLITLSLALRRPDRWALSIGSGLAACLFREVALPYLLVMAVFALYERRWREAAAWSCAIALFVGLFAVHCGLAAAQHRIGDLSSNGWLKMGGLRFVIATARWNTVLALAPPFVVALALGVAAIGLSGARNPLTARGALILVGYAMAFAVVGRPDNDYWGILYAPMVPLGVALSPPALKDLASRAFGTSVLRRWGLARPPAGAASAAPGL